MFYSKYGKKPNRKFRAATGPQRKYTGPSKQQQCGARARVESGRASVRCLGHRHHLLPSLTFYSIEPFSPTDPGGGGSEGSEGGGDERLELRRHGAQADQRQPLLRWQLHQPQPTQPHHRVSNPTTIPIPFFFSNLD